MGTKIVECFFLLLELNSWNKFLFVTPVVLSRGDTLGSLFSKPPSVRVDHG